jgi:hypothetical protein
LVYEHLKRRPVEPMDRPPLRRSSPRGRRGRTG